MINDGKHRNIYTSYITVKITKSGCRYTTVTVRQGSAFNINIDKPNTVLVLWYAVRYSDI